MAKACAKRDYQFHRAGYPEDDTDLAAVITLFLAVAGIFECLTGSNHPEKLGSINGLQSVGRDIVFHRIKRERGDEATAATVGMIRRFRVRVMIVGSFPVRCGNLADGINPFADVCPVRGTVFSPGEKAAYAYDCQLAAVLGQFQIVNFHLKVLLQLCIQKRGVFYCFGREMYPLGTEHGCP